MTNPNELSEHIEDGVENPDNTGKTELLPRDEAGSAARQEENLSSEQEPKASRQDMLKELKDLNQYLDSGDQVQIYDGKDGKMYAHYQRLEEGVEYVEGKGQATVTNVDLEGLLDRAKQAKLLAEAKDVAKTTDRSPKLKENGDIDYMGSYVPEDANGRRHLAGFDGSFGQRDNEKGSAYANGQYADSDYINELKKLQEIEDRDHTSTKINESKPAEGGLGHNDNDPEGLTAEEYAAQQEYMDQRIEQGGGIGEDNPAEVEKAEEKAESSAPSDTFVEADIKNGLYPQLENESDGDYAKRLDDMRMKAAKWEASEKKESSVDKKSEEQLEEEELAKDHKAFQDLIVNNEEYQKKRAEAWAEGEVSPSESDPSDSTTGSQKANGEGKGDVNVEARRWWSGLTTEQRHGFTSGEVEIPDEYKNSQQAEAIRGLKDLPSRNEVSMAEGEADTVQAEQPKEWRMDGKKLDDIEREVSTADRELIDKQRKEAAKKSLGDKRPSIWQWWRRLGSRRNKVEAVPEAASAVVEKSYRVLGIEEAQKNLDNVNSKIKDFDNEARRAREEAMRRFSGGLIGERQEEFKKAEVWEAENSPRRDSLREELETAERELELAKVAGAEVKGEVAENAPDASVETAAETGEINFAELPREVLNGTDYDTETGEWTSTDVKVAEFLNKVTKHEGKLNDAEDFFKAKYNSSWSHRFNQYHNLVINDAKIIRPNFGAAQSATRSSTEGDGELPLAA